MCQNIQLRCDRVLYGPPPSPIHHQKGRHRVHGDRFAFKEPETWGMPDEIIELEHPRWGQVRLERWQNLHEKKGADVPYDVIRACVHLERDKPPAPLRLAWLAPEPLPKEIPFTVETIWQAYGCRWPVEPVIQFQKERLGWTQPRFQSKEVGDHWGELISIACWMLFLTRSIVADNPLPWQKPQQRLTPQRVQQSLQPIFELIGSPTRPPKVRGKAPGRPKGRHRTPKQRFKVVKKTPAAAKTA